jgi:hypothetical protein
VTDKKTTNMEIHITNKCKVKQTAISKAQEIRYNSVMRKMTQAMQRKMDETVPGKQRKTNAHEVTLIRKNLHNTVEYKWIQKNQLNLNMHCKPVMVRLQDLKPGKDKSSAASYRPISLTICVSKLFEKLVINRMVYTLENREVIPE